MSCETCERILNPEVVRQQKQAALKDIRDYLATGLYAYLDSAWSILTGLDMELSHVPYNVAGARMLERHLVAYP